MSRRGRTRQEGSLAGVVGVVKLFGKVSRGVSRLDVNTRSNLTGNRARPVEGYFDPYLWEQNYSDVIDKQADIPDLNPGQQSIVEGDFTDAAKSYCATSGEDYNSIEFVSSVRAEIGDEKFNAISELIENCSEELWEAWDLAYGGDNMGAKLFGRYGGAGTIMWRQIGGSINATRYRK